MNTSCSAALLLDLQRDFLSADSARMYVGEKEAQRVIAAANAVLTGRALTGALPVFIVNAFPRSAWVTNFFRHGAAIEGTSGAAMDDRVRVPAGVKIFPKRRPSAFTNPELLAYLGDNSVARLYVLGVFAEGCVRATAIDGVRRGYRVVVPTEAIGTNSQAKRWFALWAMRRGGVELVPMLPAHAV